MVSSIGQIACYSGEFCVYGAARVNLCDHIANYVVINPSHYRINIGGKDATDID